MANPFASIIYSTAALIVCTVLLAILIPLSLIATGTTHAVVIGLIILFIVLISVVLGSMAAQKK